MAGLSVPGPVRGVLNNITKKGSTPAVFSSVQAAGGFPKQEITEASSIENADYYRNGYETDEEFRLPKQIKPFWSVDGTNKPASLRVFGRKIPDKGGQKSITDGDLIPPYTKIILSDVAESSQERSQVIQTFSDTYIFFYGKQPSYFTFSGTLINTKDVNWVQDFYFMYENYFRGTKLVELNAKFVITYGGRQIEGIMLNCRMNTSAASEEGVPVTFEVFVTKRLITGFSDDFGLLSDSQGNIFRDETLRKKFEEIAPISGQGTSIPTHSYGYSQAKKAMAGGAAQSADFVGANPFSNIA
jgi:hypothetical protein